MDNDGGITDSDTSSDTKSKVSFNDIVSSRGPYAYLLQWYDDRFDESVPEFKFNKRIVSKSKASKKRPSNSKQVPTLQLGFALLLSTVGSVADNKRKEKRNVRSDKSKEFPNPPPGFPLRNKESLYMMLHSTVTARITGKTWGTILVGKQSSLAVGTYTASGNSNLAVGMPCVFYSQQSSHKLDAPSAIKFSRIK
nr:hypothetical protein [Tanacetum cinerariifolium]